MPSLKDRYKAAVKNRYIVYGFIGAPIVLILISLVMCSVAKANEPDEGWFALPPYVYLGLDAVMHGGITCYSDATNKAEANLGFGTNLYARRSWEINAQYSHHSCGFDEDRQIYDGVGLQLRWYPTLWGR